MVVTEMSKIDVEVRSARAKEAFMQGYNCAQSVVVAYADVLQQDVDALAMLVSPLGGGMGRLREVCGAVSGMFMVSSAAYRGASNTDRAVRTQIYTGVQQLAECYCKECGSIICRELLNLKQKSEAPVPEERTAEYYQRRPCAEYVAIAARIVGEYLNAESEKQY